MPTAYKVLGQSAPGATTSTTLYTVPAATETVVSTFAVTNRAAISATFRLAIRPDGATLANEHYIVYDAPIAAYDSIYLTVGATINANDVITVYGSTANLSFSAFGSETS
jgi:hypothetical protein